MTRFQIGLLRAALVIASIRMSAPHLIAQGRATFTSMDRAKCFGSMRAA